MSGNILSKLSAPVFFQIRADSGFGYSRIKFHSQSDLFAFGKSLCLLIPYIFIQFNGATDDRTEKQNEGSLPAALYYGFYPVHIN